MLNIQFDEMVVKLFTVVIAKLIVKIVYYVVCAMI